MSIEEPDPACDPAARWPHTMELVRLLIATGHVHERLDFQPGSGLADFAPICTPAPGDARARVDLFNSNLLLSAPAFEAWSCSTKADVTSAVTDAQALPAATDYSTFFSECYPKLLRRLQLLCASDPTLAEDLTQEAFLLAYRHWDRLAGTAHPYAWVKKVATRLAWRWLRLRAEQTAALTTDLLDLADEMIAGIPMLVDLKRALATLPLRQREVATLRMLLDFEPIEIAEVLGIAAGTVRAHLHAARQTLGIRLEGPRS